MNASASKPSNFDQLYPGRFAKAGDLDGKKLTLTIADVDREELQGDDGKAQVKAIVKFREVRPGVGVPWSIVACKTNGLCIRAMFGPEVRNWIGKRVTLFTDQWNGEPCIRIWGSPDIDGDMQVEIKLARKRPRTMTMHKMAQAGANGTGRPAAKPAAVMLHAQAIAVLEAEGIGADEFDRFLASRENPQPPLVGMGERQRAIAVNHALTKARSTLDAWLAAERAKAATGQADDLGWGGDEAGESEDGSGDGEEMAS